MPRGQSDGIKAVCFDIDGTLLDEAWSVERGLDAFYAAHAADLRWPRGEFGRIWRGVTERHMRSFLKGEVSFREQRRRRMREIFGAPSLSDGEADGRFHAFLRAYEDSWRPYPDVLPCLQSLQDSDLGAISNGDPDQQAAKLKHLGLAGFFRVLVTTGEAGCAKPSPGIFQEACRRLGREPEACAYVGDSLEVDALGACGAGWRGIWLNRSGGPAGPSGIRTIASLVEIAAALA